MPFRRTIVAFIFFCPLAGVSIKLQDGANDPSGQCLKFMHIGKTGGTTIDKLNFMHPKNDRPYRSYMEGVFDGIAQRESARALPGQKARTAEEIFTDSHTGPLADIMFIGTHFMAYTWWPNPVGGVCHTHMPPLEGTGAREFYSDGCTNFCVVRDPLTRMLSYYKMLASMGAFQCSAAGFDQFVALQASNFAEKQYDTFCIVTPQLQMVYGTTSRDAATHPPICDRPLRYEHIEEDFDALMKEFKRDVKLSDVPAMFSPSCHVKPGDLSQTTKNKVFELYRGDYEAFNYTRP